MKTRNIIARLRGYTVTDKTYGAAVMGATDTVAVRTPDSTAFLEELSASLIEHPDRPRQWVRPDLISDRGHSLLPGSGREALEDCA